MGLPENIANEPLPIASLTALVKPEATVFPVNQPAPVSLQGAGQFRIVVENEEEETEIVLVVGGASTGSWIVERAQEGTTALSFVAGTGISHELTAGAVKTFAPLSSPVLTGTPTAPTAAAKTATAQLATTAFAETAKGEAEEAVTVERERAEEAEVLLAPKASPALTGTPTAPTATALTDSTQLATTAYADGAVAVETTRAEAAEAANAMAITAETTRAEAAEVLKAPLANPALTGVPTAPTAAANTNTTQIATTAAVHTAKTEAEAAAAAAQATAEAESIPLAQKGAASGVASLTAGGIGAQPPAHHASTHAEAGSDPLTAGDLPASVVSSSAEEVAGEAEGNLEPAIAGKRIAAFAYTIKGTTVLKPPTGAPAGFSEVLVRITQNSAGGHTFSTSGITWNGGEPAWPITATSSFTIALFTLNGGTTWEAQGPEKGATGATGATGPEAVGTSRLWLPESVTTYKNPTEEAHEARQALAETVERGRVNTTLLLTSGTPIFRLIEIPAKTVCTGVFFYVATTEGTPANRTHLWVAMLKPNLEKLRVSEDYTSSVHTPLGSGLFAKGIKFTEPFETGSKPERYVVGVCEVMSSTNPITVGVCNSSQGSLNEMPPRLAFLGETGLTTPASLAATVVPSATTLNLIYAGII